MKLWEFLLIMAIISLLGISIIVNTGTIGKQQAKINQLTERVLLLENALSDQIGIKK